MSFLTILRSMDLKRMEKKFKNKVAFIIPTKDRPDDLRKLLVSFEKQSYQVDQIILVDGGEQTVEKLVAEFPALKINYLRVYPPGFTKQKNAGTVALESDITLVGYLDDDIVLEAGTIEKLLSFWENAGSDVGGTSFNITNQVFNEPNIFTRIFGTNNGRGGTILRSGFNVVLHPVVEDTEVQWLCGGATVWRREVVKNISHDEWFEGYGHMDDIDYSCMVGAKYKMFVLRNAKVAHYEKPISNEKNYVFGVYDTVNRYYLVKKYSGRFSKWFFYWATLFFLNQRV